MSLSRGTVGAGACSFVDSFFEHPAFFSRNGLTANRELWDWRETVLEGTAQRRDGHLVLNGDDGKSAQCSALSLSSTATKIVVEELVLVVESFERVTE
ncbi:hypothetical protein [Streptomyces sp. NPDC088246]|uniref:hypothetical protein n=1 Tax=Streptomyces sp. NPDC088246 TaxID=3365842 RepID=UPI0037FAF44B